jgi:N-acetylmuramoyl-L-alanine amidase
MARTEPVMAVSGGGSASAVAFYSPEAGYSPDYIAGADGAPGIDRLDEKTVCLDPGHGGIDDGAVRVGVIEQEINMAVALLVKEMLEAETDIRPVLSRSGDEKPDSLERAVSASAYADMLISIHCNTYGQQGVDNDVTGTEVHYTAIPGLDNEKLANIMLSGVCEAAGSKNRGLFGDTDLILTTNAAIPCVLIEMGFISNAVERGNLSSPAYRDKIARGIFNGIVEAFETF